MGARCAPPWTAGILQYTQLRGVLARVMNLFVPRCPQNCVLARGHVPPDHLVRPGNTIRQAVLRRPQGKPRWTRSTGISPLNPPGCNGPGASSCTPPQSFRGNEQAHDTLQAPKAAAWRTCRRLAQRQADCGDSDGMAAISRRVYSCCGSSSTPAAAPCSTSRPCCMTPMSSLMKRMTAMS